MGRGDDERVEHFRELHAKQAGRVFGYARGQLNDEHLAQDATQESFDRYWQKFRHTHHSLPRSPDAYLWTIVRRTVITIGKRSKRDGPPQDPGEHPTGHANDPAGVGARPDRLGSIDAWEQAYDLQTDRCWTALATPEKTALYLHHALDMPVDEVAASMGRTVSAIHGVLARGASNFRKCVKRREDGRRNR